MSNCFSSYPSSPFPGSNYYFTAAPSPTPSRNSMPNMSMPTMSSTPTMSGHPTMSSHSFAEPEAYFAHPGGYQARNSAYFVNPNTPVYSDYMNYNPNVAQYLHYQRMQHLSRAQFIHNQGINNLIANIHAYRRSRAHANGRSFDNANKETDANKVIITEVTDDEEEFEIDGKKCIDKKDYVDAISIDGEETLV